MTGPQKLAEAQAWPTGRSKRTPPPLEAHVKLTARSLRKLRSARSVPVMAGHGRCRTEKCRSIQTVYGASRNSPKPYREGRWWRSRTYDPLRMHSEKHARPRSLCQGVSRHVTGGRPWALLLASDARESCSSRQRLGPQGDDIDLLSSQSRTIRPLGRMVLRAAADGSPFPRRQGCIRGSRGAESTGVDRQILADPGLVCSQSM